MQARARGGEQRAPAMRPLNVLEARGRLLPSARPAGVPRVPPARSSRDLEQPGRTNPPFPLPSSPYSPAPPLLTSPRRPSCCSSTRSRECNSVSGTECVAPIGDSGGEPLPESESEEGSTLAIPRPRDSGGRRIARPAAASLRGAFDPSDPPPRADFAGGRLAAGLRCKRMGTRCLKLITHVFCFSTHAELPSCFFSGSSLGLNKAWPRR